MLLDWFRAREKERHGFIITRIKATPVHRLISMAYVAEPKPNPPAP